MLIMKQALRRARATHQIKILHNVRGRADGAVRPVSGY